MENYYDYHMNTNRNVASPLFDIQGIVISFWQPVSLGLPQSSKGVLLTPVGVYLICLVVALMKDQGVQMLQDMMHVLS